MASTEDNHSNSSQSLWRLSLFYPYLASVIADVQSSVLVDPVYICVECSVVHRNQQTMAAHCKSHIRSDGMAKGTVRHIKYNPDHTFSLLCHPSSNNIYYQVTIPNYDLSPNSSEIGVVRVSDIQQKCVDIGYIQHPASVTASSAFFVPAATPPALDLTLRLGHRSTADSTNEQIVEALFAGSAGSVTAAKIGDERK
uniref:Uncharacterized protein n=1 Tax=Oryza punctata TaxID=4537 RepID=A0A0E0LB61_ORYPU